MMDIGYPTRIPSTRYTIMSRTASPAAITMPRSSRVLVADGNAGAPARMCSYEIPTKKNPRRISLAGRRVRPGLFP